MPVTSLDHPLASHLLSGLRDEQTSPQLFRRLAGTLTTLLAVEATRTIHTQSKVVQTPVDKAETQVLAQPVAVVPVLRAGLGMLEPIVQLFPDVTVGYIGLERHHDTAVARSYYCKLPFLGGRFTLCVDPMLATGGSASQAVSLIKAHGGDPIVMVCVVAAPEGIEKLEQDHPGIQVVTAAIDTRLNELKYIVPGLGDFGDRLYGTS